MTSHIVLEDKQPWLVREIANREKAQERCNWINAASGTAVVGPARIQGGDLLRPYVLGKSLDRLEPSQCQTALREITETIDELHSRGLVHLALCAESVLSAGNSVYLLDATESRESCRPEDLDQDLNSLKTLHDQYAARELKTSQPLRGYEQTLLTKMGVALLGVLALICLLIALDSEAPTAIVMSTSTSVVQQPDLDSTPASTPRQLFGATTSPPSSCDISECTESVSWRDGVLTVDGRQFALGSPGDQFFYGNWDCAVNASPALLTRGGSLYVFTDWDLPAVRTRVGPGSRAELVIQEGCDGVLVTSPNGDTVRFPTSD